MAQPSACVILSSLRQGLLAALCKRPTDSWPSPMGQLLARRASAHPSGGSSAGARRLSRLLNSICLPPELSGGAQAQVELYCRKWHRYAHTCAPTRPACNSSAPASRLRVPGGCELAGARLEAGVSARDDALRLRAGGGARNARLRLSDANCSLGRSA